MDSNEKAVLQTVLYADVFDSPVDISRLSRFVISSKRLSEATIQKSIQGLIKKKVLSKTQGFVYLASKSALISKRIPNKALLAEKMTLAGKAAFALSFIGTIQFIGLSGALASGNVRDSEDIDFFILAKKNSLWVTRFISVILLEILGIRRRRNDTLGKDKICLNMFLSDEKLVFSKERHDVYTAFEIAQMVPMFSRNNMYSNFIKSNTWIKVYLSNFIQPRSLKESESGFGSRFITWFPMIQLAKFIQVIVMRSHKTKETVTDSLFAFHPIDYRSYVLSEYRMRLKKFKLL